MPITPLHLGPGLLLKSCGGSYLSLTMFALVQVTMDLEVVLRLILGSSQLHGFTNTIISATLILMVTVPLGKPICEWALRWWNRNLSPAQAQWLQVSVSISWKAAWIGAVLGAYSHLLLDAIMHADARPWMPFSDVNTLVGLISIDRLNLFCLLSLLIGGIFIAVYCVLRDRRLPARRKSQPP